MTALPSQPDFDPQTLDAALTRALTPPEVPKDFRARLMAAVVHAQVHDLETRRQALEKEHAHALKLLRRDYVRLRRDTIALVVVAAFTLGALANLAVPWLQQSSGMDTAVLMPLLALTVGAVCSALVWWERFGLGVRKQPRFTAMQSPGL